MSLTKYHKKRKFKETPEPEGTEKESTGPLTFVIQKHEATRLHYDFRLELNGVLKSWAVPKGPSLNPQDKRLAMMVEDHPLDYANFEGIIPKGNYGAGTVMVWDRGVYTPYDAKDRKEAEKELNEQLKKGHLTFIMLGEKLKGEFALIKTHGGEENAWILIKKGDEYASEKKDILKEDHSVLTNRSMNEIKNQAEKKKEIWYSKPKDLDLKDASTDPMPHDIQPMLANTADEPFDNPDWLFEIKYDGYRGIAEIQSGKVRLYSRNKLAYNQKFAPLVESLQKFPGNAVLDGEIVVVDEIGHPHFQWVQDYPAGKGELIYYVFDILYLDGHDLSELPLARRKEILKDILPPLAHIKFSGHIARAGKAMFEQAQHLGIEGIMAKNTKSTYKQGRRTDDWLKIKIKQTQEFIICGYTAPKGGRKHLGALIAGIYKNKKLTYIGHIGGISSDTLIKNLYEKLTTIQQKNCPFETQPQTNAPVTWVKPLIVAEAQFSEWTSDGSMRHPLFKGLRQDKEAPEITEEATLHTNYTIGQDSQNSTQLKVGKYTVTISNRSKIFFPNERYTKQDLINYYHELAPVILPYLKDRPQSLLRWPNGSTGESFYQKDTDNLHENFIEKKMIYSESNEKEIEYLLCQNEATLIYLINLGCIDLNPWNSRVDRLEYPDYLLIDLDPEKTSFEEVIKTALTTREILEGLDIPSYPKTSGATGMHIYIPLKAKYTYEQTRQLAELLCIQINNKIPQLTSMKRNPKERQGLVYLDYLQNRRGQTLASAYSVRAKPGATVSTPLEWSEVTKKLHPSQFTIKNVPDRVQKQGDLFKAVLGKGIDIEKVLKKVPTLH
jgi:bifunctional non-homologous end joining protein LigD